MRRRRFATLVAAWLFVAVPSLAGAAIGGDSAGRREAAPLRERIERAIEARLSSTVAQRHFIHRNPELSNQEVNTAKLVASHLRAIGIEPATEVAHTGVVGVLEGALPGPVIALRADMDGLPIVEETDLPYKSTARAQWLGNDVGVMHACGHDVHTAVLLGVAAVLADVRDALPGTVKFIFQPAEEGTPGKEDGGASMMVDHGVLRDPAPAAIFGLHAAPDLEVGELGYTAGPTMAAVDQFRIDVVGRGGHGAQPHRTVDPIVIASEIVQAFQTIRSRSLAPDEPAVLTIGIFRGGERFNIIPDAVELEGTVRTYSIETRDTIERRMRELCTGIAEAAGAQCLLDYEYITPPLVTDAALVRAMVPTLERVVGAENVRELPPVMIGEDFAEFSNRVPGMFYRLGTTTPGATSGGLHTSTFVADDGAVEVGMRAMAHLVIDWLEAAASERP